MTYRQKQIGEEIKQQRLNKHLSLRKLSAMVIKEDGKPISPAYLNDIEKNNRIPSANLIEKIAGALGFDPDYLLNLAKKISPQTERFLLEQPSIGGLLRKAQEMGFTDWKAMREMIEAEGKRKKEKGK
jgi:transcriptional regulator with XRE-family HTH domain